MKPEQNFELRTTNGPTPLVTRLFTCIELIDTQSAQQNLPLFWQWVKDHPAHRQEIFSPQCPAKSEPLVLISHLARTPKLKQRSTW
jgi:hypothetical protein